MNKYKNKRASKALVFTALLVALTAICSQIYLPTPWGVPFTLQTLFICLSGYFLGVKYSLIYISTYIFGGIVGLPFFTGFSGGIGVFTTGGGGFIIGFIPLVISCALSNLSPKAYIAFLLGAVGIIICHIFGVAGYSLVYKVSFFAGILTISLPYLLKDLCSMVLAKVIADKLKRQLEKTKR